MQVMNETFERALKPEHDAKAWLEPPIEVRLNRQIREKVATLGGLRGTAREDPLKLAHTINTLLENF